jgi:hypothetical protein
MYDNDWTDSMEALEDLKISEKKCVEILLHLVRRRFKCEKLMDDRRRTPSDSKSSLCLWQGELKKNKESINIYNGILPSLNVIKFPHIFFLYIYI